VSRASWLLVATAACHTPPRAQATHDHPLVHGAPAPEIATADARSVPLQSLRGQWVVLDFWESTCDPCVRDVPRLIELDARRAATLVSITPEASDEVREFVANHGMTWRVATDRAGTVHAAFRVDHYPLYFLIDPAGRLACVHCTLDQIFEALAIPEI